MTVKELNRILTANNIPEDATLMSDSGWECGATEMNGVYYNSKENVVVFTQYFSEFDTYMKKSSEWIKLEEVEE